MNASQRDILEAVAEGRMTPQEAAVLLEQAANRQAADAPTATMETDSTGGDAPGSQAPRASWATGSDATDGRGEGRAARVRITAAARTVRVIGDPSVLEAEIDGPHRAWREDDTLVISGGEDAGSGFSFRSRRRSHRDWRDWSDLAEWRRVTEPLVVRVHPDLAVTAELSAGSLSILGVHGPLTADLAAGSARLEAVTGPLDITTRAGSLRIQGRLTEGTSRVRCDAGSVSVRLDPGSSVRVRAHVDLGRVRFHGPTGDATGPGEVVVGAGAGLLDIEAAMASVDVSIQDPMMSSPSGR